MDNLTHSLIGLAAAKAGLERLSPGATVVCVLAANAPDTDILALLGGRWFHLQHHRGITHSIVGTLALALLLPLSFYLGDWLIARWRGRERRVRFKGLLLASVLLSLSHPLLDWTNNYGVRPFLPWNGRWFYGDLVFIVDPWIWLTVGGAAFLLTAKSRRRTLVWATIALLLSLLIMSDRPERAGLEYPNLVRAIWFSALACLALAHWKNLAARWGRSIAIAALAFVVVYWGALSFLQRSALTRAEATANRLAASRTETVSRVAAMPSLANPLRWRCLMETDRATYLFDLTLGKPDDAMIERKALRYEKPVNDDATLVASASQDYRARIMLGFARFPVARVEGDCVSQAIVQFADLRYTEPGRTGRGSGFAAVDVPVSCPPEIVEANPR
ncbi:MAG TPA: metal-dependent hydrolase [Pyrinomonadaceae bacterium]|jgi:inner membrane protein